MRDKSLIVLYTISIILIVYGVTGIGALGYIYSSKIEAMNLAINSVADQLLIASDSLRNLTEHSFISGEIGVQIEGIESSINEMKRSVDNMANDLYLLATSIDINIFGLRPFGSVADLLGSVGSATSSASVTMGKASQTLMIIRELKVKDILSEEQISIMETYSEQLATFGGMLRQLLSIIPSVLGYMAATYGMFILMGVSTAILTRKVKKGQDSVVPSVI